MNNRIDQKPKTRLSLDALIFGLLGFIQLYRYPNFFFPRVRPLTDLLPAGFLKWIGNPDKNLVNNPIERALVTLGMVLIISYLLIDVFSSTRSLKSRLKAGLLVGMIVICVIIPTSFEVFRFVKTNDQAFAHDGGVIQTQLAIDYLLNGRNPYTEDYFGTLLDDGYDPLDPPLFHFPYLPLIIETAVPFQIVFRAVFGFFDMRIIYLICFIIALITVSRFGGNAGEKLCLASAIALNPLITQFLIQGRNDIYGLMWMVLAVFLFMKKHTKIALVALACACASKPFAWMILPFMAIYLYRKIHHAYRRQSGMPAAILSVIIFLAPFWLTWTILTGPFIIWDYYSLWDDVYLFNAGGSVINYAFGGTPGVGLPNLIIYFNAIESLKNSYNLLYYQVIFCLPLLVAFSIRQMKNNSLRNAVTAYSILLTVFLFSSRLFHDNYLGYISVYLVISAFGSRLDDTTYEI